LDKGISVVSNQGKGIQVVFNHLNMVQ